jgi:hypothetical protein
MAGTLRRRRRNHAAQARAERAYLRAFKHARKLEERRQRRQKGARDDHADS